MPITGIADLVTLGGASNSEPFVTIGNTSGLLAERALTGTSSQIVVTDNGTNSTVVLSTPQNIHTGAVPTFAGLTLTSFSGAVSAAAGVLSAGTLSIANGGTGLTSTSQNFVFAGPAALGAGAPLWRALVVADIPSLDTSKLTSGLLPIARGGTNVGSQTTNGVNYFNGSIITSDSTITWDGTIFTIGAITKFGTPNTNTVPSSGTGVVAQWNGSGGAAEVDFTNVFTYGSTPGSGFRFYQRWDNSGNTLNWGTSGHSGNHTFMGAIGPYGWTATPDSNTTQNVVGVNVIANHTTTGLGTGSWRDYGLQFQLFVTGDGSTNDATSGANGFEGGVNWGSTGTLTKGVGGRASFNNTSTGTATTAYTFDFYPMTNTGGGTITTGYHAPFGSLPAITANSQNRANIVFTAAQPTPGAFTSTKIGAIIWDYAATVVGDGLNWNNDTFLFRSASATLSLTGAFKVSGKVGFNGQSPATAQTYAASNVTTDRTYDANATTLDEVADVLGTLIADLRSVGLVV